MSGNEKAKPNGFVWEQLERFINDKLSMMNPIGKTAAESIMQNQPEWVEKLVGQVLERTLPGAMSIKSTGSAAGSKKNGTASKSQRAASASVSSEVFETQRDVIAKIRLPPGENPRALQVLVRSDRIKLLGLEGESPYYIRLPATVQAKTAEARFREGYLQVQARKRRKGHYYEAYIR